MMWRGWVFAVVVAAAGLLLTLQSAVTGDLRHEGYELIATANDTSALCTCWTGLRDGDEDDGQPDVRVADEPECRCTGEAMHRVPGNLFHGIIRLVIVESGLRVLSRDCLQVYQATLKEVTLMNVRRLETIEPGVFRNLPELQTIYFHGLPSLTSIHPDVFHVYLPKLKILRIVHSGITSVPNLNNLHTKSVLHMIDLENNLIRNIQSQQVSVQAEELLLNYNHISSVGSHAFEGSQLAKLSLKGNRELIDLHIEAFVGLKSLRYIDLSETSITELPTLGLQEIDILRIQDTETLKVFPSIYNFENIREAWLTYPCHCCAFRFPKTHDPERFAQHEDFLNQMAKLCEPNRNATTATFSSLSSAAARHLLEWHPLNMTTRSEFGESWSAKDADGGDMWHEQVFHAVDVDLQAGMPFAAFCGNLSKNYRDVACHPEPDAFNPCEDLMGTWWLRISVWVVALLAIFGNAAVAVVLITSRFRMTVTKFLMCNLSIADFCIGVYLLLIAVMDARSIGVYFNHAIDWQSGYGCQIAGFLTVFGNVLSIFTLAVITCERWYTITWAIHLNRRLKLRSAVRIMMVGWCYAFVMAYLPLNGISAYSRTSICLPMEHRRTVDTAYLTTLLALNFLAFVIICTCYARMYAAITGDSQECVTPALTTRSDLTVAKRMALLVFTDFACLAPIGFFGLTALAGYPLIDVTQTKILLVFIYPLNSCANPYLYALLTQQYRRDLFILLGRYGLCKERADRCKGAIGGVPLPKGSALQYKRPSGDSAAIVKVHNALHRGSLPSVDNGRSTSSRGGTRPNSLSAVPEISLHSLRPGRRSTEHCCKRVTLLETADSLHANPVVL